MEGIWFLEKRRGYTLIRSYMARRIPIFLRHSLHEYRQCGYISDSSSDSTSSQHWVCNAFILSERAFELTTFMWRPTLMFQVIISCRLVLNLKSSGSQTTSASKSLKARSKTRQINVEVTPVTVNKSTWDSKEKSHHVKLPSRGDFAASKKLQQLRNKDPTARNWSLPAPLWNKESSGSMV